MRIKNWKKCERCKVDLTNWQQKYCWDCYIEQNKERTKRMNELKRQKRIEEKVKENRFFNDWISR